MLSKNKLKQLRSFQQKKNRDQEKLFIIEGNKLVQEALLSELVIKNIVCTQEWFLQNTIPQNIDCEIAYHEDLSKLSLLKTPSEVWALVSYPQSLILEQFQEYL